MGVRTTNKVFLQTKISKTERKRKERKKQKRLRKRRTKSVHKKEKCKSVHEFPSLVGLTSNMHSSEGNNTTSFHW